MTSSNWCCVIYYAQRRIVKALPDTINEVVHSAQRLGSHGFYGGSLPPRIVFRVRGFRLAPGRASNRFQPP
ncbi:MAG: hypothetical protein WBW73_32025, partial [Rhodoplanes sp.]